MSGLINFTNIPNHMVSGLSGEELQWVTEESNSRYLLELDAGLFEKLLEDGEVPAENDIDVDLKDLDEAIKKEMDEAEEASIPQSTKFSTDQHVFKFKAFLSSKGLSTNIESMPASFLSNYLRLYYFRLRCKDGRPYAPRSLIGIRAAIHRYLISPKVNRPINILKDQEFNRANGMIKTMIGKWLREGQKSKRYDAIEKGDLMKIRNYFDRSCPVTLQHEIWFNMMYYFGFRGRETIAQLNMDSFDIRKDDTGRSFLYIKHQLLTKSVKASLSQKQFENIQVARMYDVPENPNVCPITGFQLYKSKCKQTNVHLFPMPMSKWNESQWYCDKRNLGKDKLGVMMKDISRVAGLQKTYTNHCLRVTVVSELNAQGFQPDQISSVTGHKTTDSLTRYVRRRDAEKRHISDALTSGFGANKCSKNESDEITISSEGQEKNINVRLPQGSTLTVKFDGQFKDCTFNLHSS